MSDGRLPPRASDAGPDIGHDALHSVTVNTCENCRTSCDHLTHVPEFDFLGCDTCLAEALAVLEAELANEHEALLAETGCTLGEPAGRELPEVA